MNQLMTSLSASAKIDHKRLFSIPHWPLRSSLFALGYFAFASLAQAVMPPPGGGYPGFNTAVGQNALFSLTTGMWNTALGGYTIYSETTGNGNTAVGLNALRYSVDGNYNTAVGLNALYSHFGDSTCAFGLNALFANSVGANDAFGWSALASNTSSGNNCAFGYRAWGARRRDL
jgi:hypothetical protein